MTDTKPEIQAAAQSAATEKKPATSGASTSASPKAPAPQKKRRSALSIALVVVLVLAAALAAALWYQQKLFNETKATLSNQVEATASAAIQAGEQAQQALSMAQTQAGQIAQLKNSLNESQDLYQNLEKAFQTLTDSGSDLVLINDIDHLVSIASQQLLLSGNVGNAIIALEAAQAQLARANRPSLAALQQAINGDVDRLRAVSTVDISQLSSRLDELKVLIGQAPLLIPDDAAPQVDTTARQNRVAPAAEPMKTAAPDSSWWVDSFNIAANWSRNAWDSIRQDLGGFISVRRVQNSSALLMSPDQAGQLRENLSLRIMTAQLALMMRQPEIWSAETETLVQALNSYYDGQAPAAQRALKLAQQLAATSIDVKVPTVNNSLQALETLREANVGAANQGSTPSSLDEAPADAQPTKSQE
ncbi:MAG TPA: uroporphyrinogen-III C-methyltransferase [Eoetvoesiella sp.]